MAMVQYGLWPNCTNHCDFCLLEDRVYKTEEERLYILGVVKENLKVIDWENKFSDGISLLGGEIFYTDSEKVKESFLELIDLIINTILLKVSTAKLSVVSNGIYDPEILLKPVLDKLESKDLLDRLDLNFSFDIKYRFHSEESKKQMISTVNYVYDNYKVVPWVQTCLTQYLIDAQLNGEFNLYDYQKKHFPHTRLAYLYPHKINTGKEVGDFFFTRKSFFNFIKWLKDNDHYSSIQQIIQSVINSSQFKYTGIYNRSDEFISGTQPPTLEKKQITTECGHSQLYRCYSDSDKCLLCDILNII